VRQKDNEKFCFLDYGDPMNDYYQVIKKAIATGQYKAKSEEEKCESESDSDSDSSGGYLHPSLIANAAAQHVQAQKTRTPSPQPIIDESHPLYRIISQRRQREIEKDNLEKIGKVESERNSAVRVPPPDICQTVEWVTKELASADVAERPAKEKVLREQSTLEFMQRGHAFYNYFQTILQRTLLTSERSFSPPPPPSATKIAYQSNGNPISFKIASKIDNLGAEKRKEEAIKKAQEVAQAIEARKIQSKEMENKLAQKARERLVEENAKLKEEEQFKRDSHQQMIEIRESAKLVKQGLVPPPPSANPAEDISARSRDRKRSRSPKRRRSRSRSRSRSRNRYSRSRSRERSRERSKKRSKKSRRRRRRSYSESRSRSPS